MTPVFESLAVEKVFPAPTDIPVGYHPSLVTLAEGPFQTFRSRKWEIPTLSGFFKMTIINIIVLLLLVCGGMCVSTGAHFQKLVLPIHPGDTWTNLGSPQNPFLCLPVLHGLL